MSEYLELITESGRVYHVDVENGFWSRSPYHTPHRIWQLKAGNVKDWPKNLDDDDVWTNRTPKIGEHMFIAGRDEWYVSNKIVSMEQKSYDPA